MKLKNKRLSQFPVETGPDWRKMGAWPHKVEVGEFPRDSDTNSLAGHHPSWLFPTLVESAARFVRGIVTAAI